MSMKDDELSALIQSQGSYHNASEQLRAKVRTQLTLAAVSRPVPPSGVQTKPIASAVQKGTRWVADVLGWRGMAAGFLMGVALTMVLAPRLPKPNLFDATTQDELVADHVRSLRVGPLFQVESTDKHTVKPWFQGKLDYAPPVIDLADEGYPLLGARVERIDQDSVAALVYGRRKHIVNLFVWPSDATSEAKLTQVRGFNVMHWSDTSMQFWVVSDMDQAELQHFVQSLQLRRQRR